MNEKIAKMQRTLKQYLDQDRYNHTMGVMYTAGCMAMKYGADLDSALIAGLLHDCAKCIPNEEKIQLCNKHNIPISDTERINPGLLHSKLGAWIAEHKYGVQDKDILHAIEYHTTGCPAMSLLDKIIYIADYIEPGRRHLKNHDIVRKMAFEDIDICLHRILKDSLAYIEFKKWAVDPMTEQAFQYYEEKLNSK